MATDRARFKTIAFESRTAHSQTVGSNISRIMKEALIKICAWFSLIIFTPASVVGLFMINSAETLWTSILITLIFALFALTGWHGKKFGSDDFQISKGKKIIAALSLAFGLTMVVGFPLLIVQFSGTENSISAIRNLVILFLPTIILSIAILFIKQEKTTNLKGGKRAATNKT